MAITKRQSLGLVLILGVMAALASFADPEPGPHAPPDLDCRSRAELHSHKAYLEELSTHYCDALFRGLAPAPPAGTEPLVDLPHANPALPNYLHYPDIDPMMGNTRRLTLIANCMHKRCLAASTQQELLCRGSIEDECQDPKGTFLLDALISDITEVCKPNGYTLRHVGMNLARIYSDREQKRLSSCNSKALTEYPDLQIMLGGSPDTCSLERPDCPDGFSCVRGLRGTRCLLTEHAATYRPAAPTMSQPASPGTCGNGVVDAGEACDSGPNQGQPIFGAWCTADCQWAHCGDSILDPGEACECDTTYQTLFFEKPKLQQAFGSLGHCPGRFSVTRGQERALGFQCRDCQLAHPKHPREWRSNAHYLPEKDLTKPVGQPAAQD